MARKGYGRQDSLLNTSTYPDDDSYPIGSNEWNKNPKTDGIFGFTKSTSGISSNGVTITDSYVEVTDAGTIHKILPSTAALPSANYGSGTDGASTSIKSFGEGDLIYVIKANGVGTVTLNHQQSGVTDGKINTLSEDPITLDENIPKIFMCRNKDQAGNLEWFEYGGGVANNLTLDNFDATKIITQAEGIANNDNETTLPTSAAVRDYADTKAPTASPTFTGTMIAATLDISGDVDVDGTLETDALTIGGTTLAATINATKIDDLTAGDDNTDIDASSSRHGLFSKLDKIKIDTIETSATADQTGAEIKAAYEAEANAFTDAKNTILSATAGTVSASKAVITDASNNLTGFNNVTIGGNLTVSGTTTTIDTATLVVEDPLIKLAKANTTDSIDIGFYGMHDSGSTAKYTGLFRDQTDSDKWKLFKELQEEPTTTVNTGGTGYATATLVANIEGNVTGNLTGDASGVADNVVGIAELAGIPRGKIIVGDASGDPSLLAAGADNTVLTMDSNGDVGWEAPAGGGATATHDFTKQAHSYTPADYTSSGTSTTRYLHVRPLKLSSGAEDTNNEGVFIRIKKNGTHNTEVQIA